MKKEKNVLVQKPIFNQKKCLDDLEHYKDSYPMHFYDACVLDKETVDFAIACILERAQLVEAVMSATETMKKTNETITNFCK